MNMMTTRWMEEAESLSFDALVQMAIEIAERPRPMPPAWMIAPSFRAEPYACPGQEGRGVVAAAAKEMPPYRTAREVPRGF